MISFQSQWFVISLILFVYVQSKKVCDFTDEKCMTKGANHMYKTLTSGINSVETCDPLCQETMEGQVDALKYKVTNVTFTGMADCNVTRLICSPTDLTFEYFLHCPRLVLTSCYETEGTLISFQVDGAGEYCLIIDDYEIKYKGVYRKFISDKDQTPRVFIKSFDFDASPQGPMIVELTKLYKGNREQCDQAVKHLNSNREEMNTLLRKSVIDGLLIKFLRNLSDALKTFHLDELVPKDEN